MLPSHAAVVPLILLLVGSRTTAAQDVLHGIVLDSATDRTLPHAVVEACRRQPVRTDVGGHFAATGCLADDTIAVRRIGYHPAYVRVGVRGARDTLIIHLAARATQLIGITVTDEAPPPGTTTLTPRSIRQTPALVEPDPFRAVAFLPGIVQASDLRGRLFLAGGRSDETGIRLDDHPLQSPFHFSELLGSFNVAALERVDVRMHRLGAEETDRLSGVIALTSRLAGPAPKNEATLSLLSSSFTTSQPSLPGGVAVLASGRISYPDKLAPALYSDRQLQDVPLYGFADGVVSVARDWANGTRAQFTGFITADHVDAIDRRGREGSRPYSWGEWMLGQTVSGEVGAVTWRLRASLDRGTARFAEGRGTAAQSLDITSDRSSAALTVTRPVRAWDVTLGGLIDHTAAAHAWRNVNGLFQSFAGPRAYVGEGAVTAASVLAGTTGPIGSGWRAGLELRGWSAVGNEYLTPSMWLHWDMLPALRLGASFERRLQFEAELGEPSVGFGRAPVFTLQVPRRADVLGLTSRWSSAARAASGESRATLSLELFHKRYQDRTRLVTPDSFVVAGSEDWTDFPELMRESGRGHGMMMSGRITPTSWLLGQGQYTWQRSYERLDGTESPTNWDVPHQASGIVSLVLPSRWTASVTGQWRSGLPATPVAMRIFEPTPDSGFGQRYIAGDRNAGRLPAYARLDAGVRRTWGTRREWTLALQVQNLFFRRNATQYRWFDYFCSQQPGCVPRGAPDQLFESRSLPIIPSLGLEVRW